MNVFAWFYEATAMRSVAHDDDNAKKAVRAPVWFALRNGSLKRSPNHSRKGARMFAICRAISLSRGTQSSFPHIIIRTM